ncbi:MAG: GNAT family N-acetyltransferase [Nitratireductor sp.]
MGETRRDDESGTVTVRPATAADSAAITALLALSYPAAYAGWYEAELLARALPFMTRANPGLIASGTFHVAFLGGRLAGCGGWSPCAPDGRQHAGTAHLRHFAVDPAAMRRGIGRALFLRCRDEARARGFTRLECQSSLLAETFYRRLGFERAEAMAITLPDGTAFPGVLMQAAIT